MVKAAKPLMENFSPEEETLIRSYLFTNPNGDISLVYPQPLVAGEELAPLMSAVSRTHMPMQDRVLQFLDQAKEEQTREMLPLIKQEMDIFRHPSGTLKISRKTGNFNKEWVLAHGHDSIKEGTAIFGHAENVSDIAGKKCTGHPMNHPQVASTRYMDYKKKLKAAVEDTDLQKLGDEVTEHQHFMNERYLEMTDRLADTVAGTKETEAVVAYLRQPAQIEAQVQKWIQKEQRIRGEDYIPSDEEIQKQRSAIHKGLDEDAVRKDIGKFVLDTTRVWLTAATRTSQVFSMDARTMEEIITDYLSSPRDEDQKIGQSLWHEAKKIAPVLLGEKSHVKIDLWKVQNEHEFRTYCQERFGHLSLAHDKDTVNVLTPRNIEMYTDRFNAALAVFPYVDAPLQSIFAELNDADVKDVLKRAHAGRDKHGVLHPAISHGGLMLEFLMGYHGYRDLFRHRRGSRSVQLLTTAHGFEVPDILEIFGLADEYRKDMARNHEVFSNAVKKDAHRAEKIVGFGALCRSLHSWQMNQVGYIGRLRTDIDKGNLSYVNTSREMMQKVSALMPETAQYFRIDDREYPAGLWKKGYEWFDATQRRSA
jgi:thymidylate synthase ThyX